MSSKPGGVEQLLDPARTAERERAGRVGRAAARSGRARPSRDPISASHGLASGAVPRGERDPPAGPQHAPRLAQRRLRVGEQHVAPAAEHGVDAAPSAGRSTRPPWTEFDVVDADLLARARCAASTIASASSVMIAFPPGATSSAASSPVSPAPAASSSTRWPGCRCAASDSHCETADRVARKASARARPARRRGLPALAAVGAVRLGVHATVPARATGAIRAAGAGACPTASAAAASREAGSPWAPCSDARRAGAVGAQLVLARRRRATGRRSPPPPRPTRASGAPCDGGLGDRRVAPRARPRPRSARRSRRR